MKKSLNALLAFGGFTVRSDRAPGPPLSAFIEPTNACNLHCPLCACGSDSLDRPKGAMSLDGFTHIIDSLPRGVNTLYLWGQGEPFLAPDFLGMVEYASSRGLTTITSTNGHFLDDPEKIASSGLNKLIVSLDGIDEASYTSYRVGGDFRHVVDSIERLTAVVKEKRRGPAIELQYLVTRVSQGNIPAFKSLAARLGADRVVFKTMQAASMNGDAYLPEDLKLTRYKRGGDGQLVPDRRRPLEKRCLRLYYSFQVDWQGNILPCCFDKDSMYIMGNLFEGTFDDIWNGDAFRSFRKTLAEKGRVFPMCGDCTEGIKRMELDF